MNGLKICVPSSSGNIGSGFDTLGIALSLTNTFEIYPAETETSLEIISGLEDKWQPMCLQMAKTAANHFFTKSGIAPIPFHIKTENHVPIARGLASSATYRLAILAGLNQLTKAGVSHEDIVHWVSDLEGSTDNAAACYFGGMTASGIVNGRLIHHKIELSEKLDFVAVSPLTPVETDMARTIFTKEIDREDAVFTLSRGILLTMAFANRAYDEVGDLFEDRLHQPQRQANIPALNPLFDVIQAARQAGALGAFLSGSTMMALTFKNKETVAAAMQESIQRYGMDSEVRYLKVDNHGIRMEKISG
jgi:homoserine kinase